MYQITYFYENAILVRTMAKPILCGFASIFVLDKEIHITIVLIQNMFLWVYT